MNFNDMRGQEVTASSESTVEILDQFTNALLGFSDQTGSLAEAAASDTQCPLAQAYACMVWLSSETAEGWTVAKPFLDQARALEPYANPREKRIIAASGHWFDGNLRKAATILDELLTEFPADVTSAKICQGIFFNLGDAPGILRAPMKVANECADIPYTHGMLAFGFEECNLLEEAENAALRAIHMKRKEPWAHHAFAHVCEGRGDCEKGAEFLAEMSETWSGITSFMHTHNWWHLCLFFIDLDKLDEALAIFDAHVWGVDKACVQDQIGAISLLYRLQRVGVDPGDRWNDIAKHVSERAADQISVFLDLQYAYALARVDNPEAERMVERIRRRAREAAPHEQTAWRRVADIAAPAIVELAHGNAEPLCEKMAQVFPYLSEIGGSHAQRDLMHLFYLDALLASGRFDRARGILERRRRSRPSAGWIRRALHETYMALDLPEVARAYDAAAE